MEVYDRLIKQTKDILAHYEYRELRVDTSISWPCLKNNEFLMAREVAFELGERFKPSTVFHCPTSNKELISEDRILLIGKDLNQIKKNVNFSRITFFHIEDEKNQNQAYIKVKRLEYERYKIIPEGYMVLSSSVDNKENIRVSKKAIKEGLDFSILGNTYINHYKKIDGVKHVQMIFIVGDYPCIEELMAISKKIDEVTDAFDHLLKNVILDCEVCPLRVICDDIEALRELHFNKINKKNEELWRKK